MTKEKIYHDYQYYSTENYDKLIITFIIDKYNEENKDKIFNDIIKVVTQIESKCTLTNKNIENINKFLEVARHTIKLDIRNYL